MVITPEITPISVSDADKQKKEQSKQNSWKDIHVNFTLYHNQLVTKTKA